MADVLLSDDPLYEEIYDANREAIEIGNFVEEDMHPAMSALRARAPVQKGYLRELLGLPPYHRSMFASSREGFTCFTFETCSTAFRDNERFLSRIYEQPGSDGQNVAGMLEMDEPEHRAYRNTMQPMFLRHQSLTWWRERWIDEIVDQLVGRLRGQATADLNLQLCARVPVHTVTRAFGMDGDNSLVFRNALNTSASARAAPEARAAAAQTVERMLFEVIAQRRVEPADDVVSGLINAEIEFPDGVKRPLSDREIFNNVRLGMMAGGTTSWRQFGITLWSLLTHRDQLEAVKADRKLVDKAIEEAMRLNPTNPLFSRLVAHDTELGGVHLPAGSVLDICLGAANRDPARWDSPDSFNLFRPSKPHLGFGAGPHQCMGMHVARAEISVGVNALLDAFPNVRLDPNEPPPFLAGGFEQRGVSALPVLLA